MAFLHTSETGSGILTRFSIYLQARTFLSESINSVIIDLEVRHSVLELFLKPVYEDKIGVFVDLGSILFLQDGARHRRGFLSHILPASGASMVKRDNGYNAERTQFYHIWV